MPDYEWDDAKNAGNQRKHGLSFEDADGVFRDPDRMVSRSDRGGERRYKAVGRVLGIVLAVVYTMRRAVVRIISFRRAAKKEKRAYLDQLHNKPK